MTVEVIRWGTLALAYVAVGIMLWANYTMRKANRLLRMAVQPTIVAASNMWDVMTPEQIRTLHPITVEVGNGVPPWEQLKDALV